MWLSIAMLLACRSATRSVLQPERVPAGVTITMIRVETGGVDGLSGAAIDAQQQIWAVAERKRALLPLRREGDVLRVRSPVVSLVGLAAEIETEALAWLGDNRFVFGTESDSERTSDAVIVVRVDGARATVERTYPLNYTLLGTHAATNAGIEGACAVGDRVLFGIEERLRDGVAALAMLNLKDGSWKPLRLRLSTATGKLASFDCASGVDGAIDVLAIERHYEVARVLSFSVAATGDATKPIVPRVLLDLDRLLEPLPNFESIVRVGDDVVLITDNHHGSVTGPTQALSIGGLFPQRRDQKR